MSNVKHADLLLSHAAHDAHERHQAALVICSNARDRDDAAMLLEALGLSDLGSEASRRRIYGERAGKIPLSERAKIVARYRDGETFAQIATDYDVSPGAIHHHVRKAIPAEEMRRNATVTHCKHGHELTPDNVRIERGKYRVCRECKREAAQRYRKKAAR